MINPLVTKVWKNSFEILTVLVSWEKKDLTVERRLDVLNVAAVQLCRNQTSQLDKKTSFQIEVTMEH